MRDRAGGAEGRAQVELARVRRENDLLRLERELNYLIREVTADDFEFSSLFRTFLNLVLATAGAEAGTIFLRVDNRLVVFKTVAGEARQALENLSIPVGEGIAGWVAGNGRSHVSNDPERDPLWNPEYARRAGFETRNILAVPMKPGGGTRVVGVVELINRTGGPFTPDDLMLMEGVAAKMAVVVDNALMHQENRRRLRQFQQLLELGRMLNSELDQQRVRERAIGSVTNLLECEAGSLLLLDEERQELYFEVATGGAGRVVKEVRLKVGEGIAGWVAKTGEPAIVNDCRSDPRFQAAVDRKTDFETRAMVCVPVRMRGRPLGVLQGINRRDGNPFTDDDLRMALLLADQVGIALHNASLYRQVLDLYHELSASFWQMAEAFAGAVEMRDVYTGNHVQRVKAMARAVGTLMGLDKAALESLELGAVLHDLGKIGVADAVLRKAGRLDEDEWRQMARHPELGVEIVGHIRRMAGVLPAIRHHHERFDGAGYPDRLAAGAIPLPARIVAVVDTYDAMTSDRVYRRGLDRAMALAEIRANAGTQFDPEVVAAFCEAWERGMIQELEERHGGAGE